MKIYLKSSDTCYVKAMNEKVVCFSNKKEIAHNFHDMPIHQFQYLKHNIETKLNCELDIVFRT